MTLLSYAVYRQDPVFIVGQAAGIFIYSRNLWFIYHRRPLEIPSPTATDRPLSRSSREKQLDE
jgi:hypothetical protein